MLSIQHGVQVVQLDSVDTAMGCRSRAGSAAHQTKKDLYYKFLGFGGSFLTEL